MNWKSATKVVLKTILPLVGGLLVMGIAIAWLSGMLSERIEPAPTASIGREITEEERSRLDEVHEVVKEYFAEAVGTLKAASRTEIAARIMAPIDEIRVKAGDTVRAGDLLIVLDRRDMETRRSQAQAALDGARAALAQAQNDYDRDAEMFREAVIAQKRFEQTKTALEVARSNVARSEQAVSEADVNLSYTSIHAPQAGMIVDRLAEPGDIARPGATLLALYDRSSLRLEAPVMENLAVKLKHGDVLTVRIDAMDRDVQATVDEIVPQAEAASRSFLVKVALPRFEGLYEGMFGRLLIPSGERRHLCLATSAIQRIGQLEFVEALRPDGRSLERRAITTGRLGMPGRIEVLSGLSAGDRVLLPAGEES